MEKIVRKILNYEPDESLKPERDEFMSNVIALALHLLSKKKKFNFPDNCAEVVFTKMNESNAGQYDSFNKHLNYDNNIFMFGEDYTSDLPLLAHEVCHLAQDFSNKKIDQKNMTYFQTEEFSALIPYLIKFNISKQILSNEEFKTMCDYFNSFYYLQEIEFEAFCFSVEFLNSIIKIADTMELNDKEKKTLFDITYDSNIVPFVDKLKHFKNIRKDKKVKNNVDLITNKFLASFFKKHPEWQKEFLNSQFEDDVPYTLFSCLLNILTVNYNDKLAHEYFNLLSKSNFDLKHQEMIFLVQKTKINLTKQEEIIFNNVIKQYNDQWGVNINYDIIKSEKVRVQNELSRLSGENVM